MTAMDAAPARKLHSRVSLGTRLVFLIAGLGMSSWAPLVPFASERLALNGASLGALLLCLGIGSLAAMPVTGALVGRFGCRRVMFGSTLVILAMLPLLATLEVMWMMAATLMVFGAGLGMLDVAMNVQAVEVEKAAGKPMMSGFHGFFSLGGILGAGAISLLLGAGLSPLASVA
ncbi:MAG TPA: MFS transporter, partial [Pantoea sp.]|nr:MFS transporter [Pantoea sp.]